MLSKEVEVKWNGTSREWYEKHGYIFTKSGEVFTIKVEDLTPKNHCTVSVQCDYCGSVIEKTWCSWLIGRKTVDKDCCSNVECMKSKRGDANFAKYGARTTGQLEDSQQRRKATNLEKYGTEEAIGAKSVREKINNAFKEKYGVENPFQLEEVKEKSRQTSREKYGVDWYTQTDECKERYMQSCQDKYGEGVINAFQATEIKEKSKYTNLERYGVESYSQTEEAKKRYIETNLAKWGTEYSFQSEELKEKSRQTCMRKYGVPYAMQYVKIKKRAMQTLSEKGNVNTSKQQAYLHRLFGGELNYFEQRYHLDVAMPSQKIYIEYDGGGHDLSLRMGYISEQHFNKRQLDRYFFLKRLGWKLFQIISPVDYLPSDEVLLAEFNKAKEWFSVEGKWHSRYVLEIGKKAKDKEHGQLRKLA